MRYEVKKIIFLLTFLFLFALVAVWIVALYNPKAGPFTAHIITGFAGNLTAGLVGGILFLILAFYINAETEEKISEIFSSANMMDERNKIEQKVAQFKEFMEIGDHYNVRFPSLKGKPNDVFGLEYKIWACRDQSNLPIFKKTQLDNLYVVRVEGPACEEVLEKEQLEIYKKAPIKEDSFYFCRFYNSNWHMGSDSSVGRNWFEFYMSSKLGDVEYGESANKFMKVPDDPPGFERISSLHIKDDGKEWARGDKEGVNRVDLFIQATNLFVKINDSRPKKMYLVNCQKDLETWKLAIDDMGGYFYGTALSNLKQVLERKMESLGKQIPKISWHHFSL